LPITLRLTPNEPAVVHITVEMKLTDANHSLQGRVDFIGVGVQDICTGARYYSAVVMLSCILVFFIIK
jgi:hypothetical protein